MSERYVPPPPPYELSLQRDQKVTEDVQALEVSKESPFRDEERKDSKHSRALADETLRDIVTHTFPTTRSDGGSLETPRPLPPNPADIDIRPLRPRRQGCKLRPAIDIKSHAVRNDHAGEPRTPAPPFSAIGHPLEDPPYLQSMLYPGTSVYSSPSHYPSPPSYRTPRLNYDNRRPVSACSPIDHCEEAAFRPSSHVPSQSTLPQNLNLRTRLSFDPAVAYSNSQGGARTTFSAQQGATSLYSSAVSSHLHLDSAITPGSRQFYVTARPVQRNTEPSHLDRTDVQSVRSQSSVPTYHSPSTTSLYTPRPESSGGYEQRWAMSEADITRDVYRS